MNERKPLACWLLSSLEAWALLQARVSTLLLMVVVGTTPLLLSLLLSKPLLLEVKLAVKEEGNGSGFTWKAHPPVFMIEKKGEGDVRLGSRTYQSPAGGLSNLPPPLVVPAHGRCSTAGVPALDAWDGATGCLRPNLASCIIWHPYHTRTRPFPLTSLPPHLPETTSSVRKPEYW